MGLFQAVSGAIGGTLADQWLDFYGVPDGLPATAALFPAVAKGQNAGRGSNTRGSEGVITNGSKIVVPEGYGLVLVEDGAFTGFAAQPGGYIWDSEESASQSVFSGGGLVDSLIKQSWERFKFGGRPGSQQTAIFVALKELPNNKFGTQSEIYWDDAFLNTQVGAITRGTYTLKISDPLTFIRNFVSAAVINGHGVFDFTDIDNPAGEQLFNEVVGSLAPAFSMYTNDPAKGNRIARLQQDSIGFAQSLSAAVEQNYQWRSDRGLEIVKTAIISIEYDENTRELLKNVQRADALSGQRGNSNLQASVAAGIESAGENAGPGGVIGMGMATGGMGLGGLQQPAGQPAPAAPAAPAAAAPAAPAEPAVDDPMAVLKRAKDMLDAGLITQEDYDAAKAKALGL
ncbi:SPFH domain-containing protein [Nocardioides oleivorans]|uniref:SPFH domain-containing protein n=1 Tax=Nocardioides oleivorans TaxID=273676 RepID=A0A4Q2RRT3_9ACTN|nr:SPFH domain-containing protein [Nocardioides oleivorans]RYB91710.1 SPFH domain-containing protein [Nocardioides oleivorans]